MVYYDHSIAAIDTGEDKTEDRRYDSGILQERTDAGSVEVRHGSRTLCERTPRSVNMRQVRLLRFGDIHRTRGSFHGGYTMKTKKKIALATLAAAMMAVLSAFSYATDIAPQYVTRPCLVDGCQGTVRTTESNSTVIEYKLHAGFDPYFSCHYTVCEVTYTVACEYGHGSSYTRVEERGHSCGQ